MKKRSILILLALMVALLVACGGGEEAAPETVIEPPPTAEAQVVATEASPPTAEPEPASPMETIEHAANPQLIDIVWQWQGRTSSAGDESLVAVPNPEAYTVTFTAEGSFMAHVDCNNIFGEYVTDTSGTIFMVTGPSTMVACEPDSLSPDMLQMFGPAQSYEFEEDGQVLVLKWASGGPIDYYRDAEAAESVEEEVIESAQEPIQMDLQDLAQSFDWAVQPASPLPDEEDAVGHGFPPHVIITFDGESVEDVLANNGRRIYLFPSESYIELYNEAGDPIVADQFERLLQILRESGGRQGPPENPMPVLPPPFSFMNRWAQFRELVFEQGRGVSYVSDSPYRQDIGVWSNDSTGYYYQGLSENGLFYISLFWPVSTLSLPNTAADASPEVTERATNPDSNADYVLDTQAALNALSDNDWTPDISKLDTLVESLKFGGSAEDEIALPVPGEGETAGVVLAPAGVNVRSGPAAGYPSLGVAPYGTSGIISGESEDGEWLVVEVPVSELTPEGKGWLAAEFVAVDDVEALPVVVGPTKLETLQLVTWQWISLAEPAGLTAVETPESYTIKFSEDGTAAIKADCNNVSAAYTADEDLITVELGISTMAACGADSLDQLFLASLGQAAVYRYEEGDLFLDLDEGAGIMRFKVLEE